MFVTPARTGFKFLETVQSNTLSCGISAAVFVCGEAAFAVGRDGIPRAEWHSAQPAEPAILCLTDIPRRRKNSPKRSGFHGKCIMWGKLQFAAGFSPPLVASPLLCS